MFVFHRAYMYVKHEPSRAFDVHLFSPSFTTNIMFYVRYVHVDGQIFTTI